MFEAVVGDVEANQAMSYEVALKKSWVWDELYRVRNIRLPSNGAFGVG